MLRHYSMRRIRRHPLRPQSATVWRDTVAAAAARCEAPLPTHHTAVFRPRQLLPWWVPPSMEVIMAAGLTTEERSHQHQWRRRTRQRDRLLRHRSTIILILIATTSPRTQPSRTARPFRTTTAATLPRPWPRGAAVRIRRQATVPSLRTRLRSPSHQQPLPPPPLQLRPVEATQTAALRSLITSTGRRRDHCLRRGMRRMALSLRRLRRHQGSALIAPRRPLLPILAVAILRIERGAGAQPPPVREGVDFHHFYVSTYSSLYLTPFPRSTSFHLQSLIFCGLPVERERLRCLIAKARENARVAVVPRWPQRVSVRHLTFAFRSFGLRENICSSSSLWEFLFLFTSNTLPSQKKNPHFPSLQSQSKLWRRPIQPVGLRKRQNNEKHDN